MNYRMLLNYFFRLELKIFIINISIENYWNDTSDDNSHNLSDFYFAPCASCSLFLILTATLICAAQIRTLELRKIKSITQVRQLETGKTYKTWGCVYLEMQQEFRVISNYISIH